MTSLLEEINNEKTVKEEVNDFFSSLFIFGTIFIVLTINLVAVSLSLHVNYNKSFPKKLGGAIFAFLFGPIYIIINYYFHKVIKLNKPVPTTSGKIFPWY